jgi:LysM repeat protein
MLFVLFLSVIPATGQGQNLLRNPGFEETPFSTIAATSTTPVMQLAPGWERWHFGGGSNASQNVEPEYYPASDSSNGLGVPRIRNGSEAQQYLTFFATMDAGIYQQVSNVPTNAQLRFSVYVYVWSSTLDDPNLSEDPGGVNIQVGIDPTGGADAASSAIIWSQASSSYDAFNEYSVTATASSSSATVFVRSTVSTPIQHNNIYVDDASLVVLGSAGGSTTTTPTREVVIASPTSLTSTVGVTTSVPTASQPTNLPATVAQPTSVPPTNQPQSTATSVVIPDEFRGRVVHVVQQGDTVDILARLYGSDINYIISANGLNPTSALIRVGQVLVIPVRLASPATSTPRPTQVPPPATSQASQPTSAVPPTSAPEGNTSYVIQPGDTLSEIAARFNTTMSAIIQLNGITNPNNIRWGQRLIIPSQGGSQLQPTATAASSSSGTRYTVQPGDTLLRLSIRFGVPVSQLVQVNNIRNADRLFVGQVLTIP